MKGSKVILITIDTLRADRLGCYGYGRNTTPSLDAFASDAIKFRRAFAPCSYTLPSHAGILTGLYPANTSLFFSQVNGRPLCSDRETMVQELFLREGYATAAFVSSLVLRNGRGLSTGFEVYDDQMIASEANRPKELIRPGEATNERVFEWLAANIDRDLLAWIHYFDAHGPYLNPEPFRSMFPTEDYGHGPVRLEIEHEGYGLMGGVPHYQALGVTRNEDGSIAECETDARVYFSQYDAGIAYQDWIVGRLIEELKRLGIYDAATIVVTSDHGESMGENDVYFCHGFTVSPEQVMVPLLVKLPGGERGGEVVDAPVSTIDIAPCVLQKAGIDHCGMVFDGVDLMSTGRGEEVRVVLCENEWQRAVVKGELFLLDEKSVISDGFAYYGDSRALCRGKRLYDFRSGMYVSTGNDCLGEETSALSDILKQYADPKEVTIRMDESELKIAAQRIRMAEQEIARLSGVIKRKEDIISGLYNSNSWKLTAPMRRLNDFLKDKLGR